MKFFFALYLFILPLACSNNNAVDASGNYTDSRIVEVEEEMIDVASPKSVTIKQENIEQKLIKQSFLKFETTNLNNTYQEIIRFTKQNNGYVQDDNSSKSYNRITRNLVIRIPTNNFQKTIDSISKQVSFYDVKRISSKDVTEEFIDISARLKAKKELESRYLQLLSKAKNVTEILEIEKQLSYIREEIEAKQGRLKYLENKVSLSTLQIEFYKSTAESSVTVSYGTKMWHAIKSGFHSISQFFLGILHIWPFILILVLGIFLLNKWLKKKSKK